VIDLPTKSGKPLFRIDDSGRLWLRGNPILKPEAGHGLFLDRTTIALDGSIIEHYETAQGVKLRHFADGTWDVAESLCTPKDIDEARKLRRKLEAASAPAWQTGGRDA
jgi:hypothetical protein